MPQILKKEAESSVQSDEQEETPHTSEQEKPESKLPQTPIKKKSNGKWLKREHQKEASET